MRRYEKINKFLIPLGHRLLQIGPPEAPSPSHQEGQGADVRPWQKTDTAADGCHIPSAGEEFAATRGSQQACQ